MFKRDTEVIVKNMTHFMKKRKPKRIGKMSTVINHKQDTRPDFFRCPIHLRTRKIRKNDQNHTSFEQKIYNKHLDVRVDLPDKPVWTRAERDSITQVIYNLIDNAIKFCPDGGRLSLRVQSDGGKARVSVENTGPTIDKDELPLLFDRFHKADKSRSADREGWGLGLYIAKTIVGAHGGDIWATSENGVTQFNFTLPAVR